MPGFKDFVDLTVLAESDLDDYLAKQVVMKFASAAARNAALAAVLREGMVAYLDDVNLLTIYSGAAWSTIGPVHGALPAWTPVITQSVTVTYNVIVARYIRIGRLITGWFAMNITGTGTAANVIQITGLPAAASVAGYQVGVGQVYDNSATNNFPAFVYLANTTTLDLRSTSFPGVADNRLGVVAAMAVALAVNDSITGCFSYEAGADA